MQQCNEETYNQPMIVSIKNKVSGTSGTGFFVRENLIATNIHCIAGATSVSAKLLDSNTEYDVEGVVAFDDKNDLVILKVSGIGTRFRIGNSDMIKKGEFVQAIGCIDGKYETKEGVYHRSVNNGQWLQTTADTEDGYSGGPLLDGKGLFIGVNFGSGKYYSAAVTSNILNGLLSQTNEIETLTQWQNRKQIKAYDYLVKSKRKIKTKHYTEAIDNLDKTIRKHPNYIIAYINRGDARKSLAVSKIDEEALVEAQQLLRSAIDDYTEAIRLCPDFSTAYKARGTAKSVLSQSITAESDPSEKQQLLKHAIYDFDEVIRLSPAHADTYNNRADAQLHLAKSESESENTEKIQEWYKNAMIDINIAIEQHSNNPIEEDPNTALFYHTRGEIKEAMGNLSGAKYDFQEAIKNTEYIKDSTVSDDLKRVKDKLTNDGVNGTN
ncbi:MAG: trypsin-like peptidase domain-containing protein [Candidatus Poribacteria bacterium]|nr:trypsin-like peptidase domain-containing protein [Candidatus Poribacteria bacterium]